METEYNSDEDSDYTCRQWCFHPEHLWWYWGWPVINLCVTNVTKISKLWVDTRNICKLASYRVHRAPAVSMKQFDCTVLLLDNVFARGGRGGVQPLESALCSCWWYFYKGGGRGERSQLLLLYELYVFFCFFWHMNPLHWRNTLWNWSISLTANRTEA